MCEEKEVIKNITVIGKSKRKGYKICRFDYCGHTQEIQTSAINKNTYKCKTCVDIKHKKEAFNVGLELIGEGHKPSYRLYKFKKCGHTQEISISAVRDNRFKCDSCHNSQIKEEAKLLDLTFVSKGKRSGYNIYRFNKCGHMKELSTVAIRNKQIECKECIDEKNKKEAEFNNLTIIDDSKDKKYKIYKFNECGHIQELRISAVRNGVFECKTCLNKKLRDEAKKVGIELLDNIERGGYGLYRLKCGHVQEVSFASVRNNTFACKTCNGLFLKDGTLVKSHYEQIVGDFLVENKIKFQYDKRLGTKTQHKTDYYIENKDLYIEVAGGYDGVGIFEDYTSKLKTKHNLYYKNKNVLYIYPNDFKDNTWKMKLKEAI